MSADITFPQYELLRPRLQNSDEGSSKYSTPNSGWAVLGSFQKGQVLEMDLIMTAHHMVRLLETGVFQACGLFCIDDGDHLWTVDIYCGTITVEKQNMAHALGVKLEKQNTKWPTQSLLVKPNI